MTTEVLSGAAVDGAWLRDVLSSCGYDAKLVDARTVAATYPAGRPNVRLAVHHELELITIIHYWHLKKGGFGSHKDLMEKINKANSESWRDTFYIDSDGDLAVSSYITLGEQMSATEIRQFLEKESMGFATTVLHSGLVEHVQ